MIKFIQVTPIVVHHKAIQVTEENFNEVCAHVGGEVRTEKNINPSLQKYIEIWGNMFDDLPYGRKAFIGDWIIFLPQDEITVMDSDTLKGHYTI